MTETPDNQPLSEDVSVRIQYADKELDTFKEMTEEVTTQDGKALLTVTPPPDAVAFTLEAWADEGHASLTVNAGYSPSGSFIHLEQVSDGPLPCRRRRRVPCCRNQGGRQFLLRGPVAGHGCILRLLP